MKPNNVLPWSLVGILILGICLLIWRSWSPPGVTQVAPEPPIGPQTEQALRLHENGQWQEAVKKWDVLLARNDLSERQRDELGRHKRTAQREMKNKQDGKSSHTIPDSKRNKPKEPAPEIEFREYYPAGRKVRSAGFFNVNGRGENTRWGLHGEVYFGYQYNIIAETTVEQNNGNRAIFELHVQEVNQVRAVSRDAIELHPPRSPILDFVWEGIDKNVLPNVPGYPIFRRIIDLANAVDPRLRGTLTHVNEILKSQGISFINRKDLELVAQVESLAGQRFKVTYVRDLGVTQIEVLDGKQFPAEDLERLAYSSSLLMDYFIFPEMQKAQGDTWEVNAADVAGVVGLAYDVSASGTLQIERGPDISRNGQNLTELKVTGGRVEAELGGKFAGQTTITPKAGSSILYSLEDLIVREARMNWRISNFDEIGEGNLLFGTTNAHNLDVESYYEAELIPKSDGDG